VYVGDFKDGAIEGKGVYTTKDGSVYEGEVGPCGANVEIL
jgi:hypothetical protein